MAKKKTPAKAAKKTVKAKAKKTSAKKAAPAKKAAKKVAPKKVAAKKVVAKKEAPVKKAVAAPAKPAPPQLGAFPMLTQRPIAHVKPTKASHGKDDRTRYSDEELKEFEKLILEKLEG